MFDDAFTTITLLTELHKRSDILSRYSLSSLFFDEVNKNTGAQYTIVSQIGKDESVLIYLVDKIEHSILYQSHFQYWQGGMIPHVHKNQTYFTADVFVDTLHHVSSLLPNSPKYYMYVNQKNVGLH